MSDWTLRAAVPDDLVSLASLLPAPGQDASLLPSGERERLYVAVRADAAGGNVVLGCVRVRPSIGLDRPRYWFHVGRAVHAASELGLFHQQRTLVLGNDLTGAWEIADLACDRSVLGDAGREQVLCQLLRAALAEIRRQRAEAVAPGVGEAATVICELPGVRDAAGQSPFWESLGRHFYDGDPQLAAERHGPAWKTWVAALLPREPLLASFLGEHAQRALGTPDASVELQARLLHDAGFRAGRHVTVDDAGPVFEGEIDLLEGVGTAGPSRTSGASA
jgi:arginine N-succinyltransferase